MFIRSAFTAIVLSIGCLMITPGVASAGSEQQAGPIKAFPWMHEGLRISYVAKSSFTPGNVYKIMGNLGNPPDPSRITGIMHSEGMAGIGIMQYSIARLDGDNVVVALRSFAVATAPNLPRGTPPSPCGAFGFVAPASSDNAIGMWRDPAILAKSVGVQTSDTEVIKMPWKIGNDTVDTICVRVHRPDFYCSSVYDIKTGLLIHRDQIAAGDKPTYVLQGDSPQADVSIQIIDFAQMRDVNIPWLNDAAPDWIANTPRMMYRTGFTNHSFGGPPLWVLGYQQFNITDHGDGWVKSDVTNTLDSMPNAPRVPTHTAFGRGQFLGLWAGPASLAKLKAGDVLDEDGLTKMKTVVLSADNDRIVIAEANASVENDSQYEKRTGMLLQSRRLDKILKNENTMSMERPE